MLYNLLSIISIIGFCGVLGDYETLITRLVASKKPVYTAQDCWNVKDPLEDGDIIYLNKFDTVYFCAIFEGVQDGDDLCIRVSGDKVAEFGQENNPVAGKFAPDDEIVRVFAVAVGRFKGSSYIDVSAVLTDSYGNKVSKDASFDLEYGYRRLIHEYGSVAHNGEILSIVAMEGTPNKWEDCDPNNPANYGKLVEDGETFTFTYVNDVITICAIFNGLMDGDEPCLNVLEDVHGNNVGSAEDKLSGRFSKPIIRAITIAASQFKGCDSAEAYADLKDAYGNSIDEMSAVFYLDFDY